MKRSVYIAALYLIVTAAAAIPVHSAPKSPIEGLWLTDKLDGVVALGRCGDSICGRIHAILRPGVDTGALKDLRNENPKLRTRTLCGLQIIGGLKNLGDNSWGDGWIYDPHAGKTYSVQLTLLNLNLLSVHGYAAVKFLGRTVQWTRAGDILSPCVAVRPNSR